MICKVITVLFFLGIAAAIIFWDRLAIRIDRFYKLPVENMTDEDRVKLKEVKRNIYQHFALFAGLVVALLMVGYFEGRHDSDHFWLYNPPYSAEWLEKSCSSQISPPAVGHQDQPVEMWPQTCRIVHKPEKGICPANAKLLPGFFNESNGIRMDACEFPRSAKHFIDCVDELRPGESFSIGAFTGIQSDSDCGGRQVDLPKPEGCQ